MSAIPGSSEMSSSPISAGIRIHVSVLSVIAVLVVVNLLYGLPLPIGVIGHEGSTILVVLNGLRLLRPLPAEQ